MIGMSALADTEILGHIEFVLCRRCIPRYKKEVQNVIVATCPWEVWYSLKKRYKKRLFVVVSGWFSVEIVFVNRIRLSGLPVVL